MDVAERAINILQNRLEILEDIAERKKRLDEFINTEKSDLVKNNDFFMVLRRWNSYTPAMIDDPYSSKGGGYFLAWKGKGIVIDPGFNFLENFRLQGFRFADIDAVIVTHAHIDHCVDLEPIYSLNYEYNSKRDEENKKDKAKTLDIFMNIGAMKKHSGWIHLLPWKYDKIGKIQLIRPHSLEKNDIKIFESDGCKIKINVKSCDHNEVLSKICSVGFILKLFEANDVVCQIGATSDTKWSWEIQDQYRYSNLLVAHIGGVDPAEVISPLSPDDTLYKNHLGIIGTTRLIDHVKPKIAIISEFGEEMAGRRREIVNIIDTCINDDKISCLIGDIGMKIKLPEVKLLCNRPSCWSNADNNDILDGGSIIYLCRNHQI